MIETRISVYDAPAFLAMINRIRSADVAFTNFENLVGNYKSFTGSGGGGGPAGPAFGTYMQADPFVLDELKWAGLRIFSHANNHSDDYGTEGLLTSMRYFRKAGMVFAGAGENLELARAPGYFDTKKGRVALIACASSYPLSGIAGEDRPDVKGRPESARCGPRRPNVEAGDVSFAPPAWGRGRNGRAVTTRRPW